MAIWRLLSAVIPFTRNLIRLVTTKAQEDPKKFHLTGLQCKKKNRSWLEKPWLEKPKKSLIIFWSTMTLMAVLLQISVVIWATGALRSLIMAEHQCTQGRTHTNFLVKICFLLLNWPWSSFWREKENLNTYWNFLKLEGVVDNWKNGCILRSSHRGTSHN